MKVLLINPGRYESDKEVLNQIMKIRLKVPLLGLPYLAAVTPEHIEVKIIDEENGTIENFEKADLVGIGGMTLHTNRRYEIASIYRNMGIPVVLGGIHTSNMPEESLEHADSIVIGEGEYIWPILLNDFENGRLKKVYTAENQISIDSLPHPKRHLMAGPAYNYPNGNLNSIMTTRGCPNGCHFCSVTEMFGRKFRTRRVDDVIEEFANMDPGHTLFCDDNIVGNPKYANELFKAMIPLKRKWIAQSSFLISEKEELLELAANAGCYMLFIGIDSLNEKNIDYINKTNVNKISNYSENIKKIQDSGIKVFGSIIIGMDHDDESIFEKVYEFSTKNKLDKISLCILTPLPNTRVYHTLKAENRIIDYDWGKYDFEHVVIQPKKMSPEKLYDGFYSLKKELNRYMYRKSIIELNS